MEHAVMFGNSCICHGFAIEGGCATRFTASIDDVLWLRERSMNLVLVDFLFKAELAADNKPRACVKFERLGSRSFSRFD
jgi:hypothetical protein